MSTQSEQHYLKAIYTLVEEGRAANTGTLAEMLAVAPASVTAMLKKLADLGLAEYEPYRGAGLTDEGRRVALQIVRRHRLAELYLAQVLGVPWDRVHAEADTWEHVLSDEVDARMDEALGFPTVDPHGAPIPQRDGTLAPRSALRLTDLDPRQVANVVEVQDENAELLRYLLSLGLVPSAEVEVLEIAPFDGPLTLRVGAARHVVGRAVTDVVYVEVVAEALDG